MLNKNLCYLQILLINIEIPKLTVHVFPLAHQLGMVALVHPFHWLLLCLNRT